MSSTTEGLGNEIARVVHIATRFEKGDVNFLMLKLMEEVGELAQAINIESGAMTHKKQDEPASFEIADCMNVLVAIMVKLHPNYSERTVQSMILHCMRAKNDKYETIVGAEYE